MDWSAIAALLMICLAVTVVILIGRGRVRGLEQAGFSLRQEVPEEVRAAAAGLLESRLSLAWSKEERESPAVWLLEVTGYGTDDPNLYLLLYPLSESSGGQALLGPRSGREIPGLIRRHSAGLWARLEPAGRDLQEAMAGTDWYLYVDPAGPPPPAVVDGLARVARTELPRAVTGVAVHRGFLGVWTAGRALPLLAAGPQVRDAFAGRPAAKLR